jgi:hypothetical protein
VCASVCVCVCVCWEQWPALHRPTPSPAPMQVLYLVRNPFNALVAERKRILGRGGGRGNSHVSSPPWWAFVQRDRLKRRFGGVPAGPLPEPPFSPQSSGSIAYSSRA